MLGFCIALRMMMGFYCKNIYFGFHSDKSCFLTLACCVYGFRILSYSEVPEVILE